MSLFDPTALKYSPSLSDEMLCSLFCPFPADNNSTVHPTAAAVITKKTDQSHKIQRMVMSGFSKAPFPLGSFRCITALPGAQSYCCYRRYRVSEPGLKDRSPVPVVCASRQKHLHLLIMKLCCIVVYFNNKIHSLSHFLKKIFSQQTLFFFVHPG